MPFQITPAGDIVRDPDLEPRRPLNPLDILLFEAAAPRTSSQFSTIFREAGANARSVLSRNTLPNANEDFGTTPVQPFLLDQAKEDPTGFPGRFMGWLLQLSRSIALA